jgi:ketosteroid isomerase-like protein
MSEENLDLARRAYEAWNRDDFDWILDRITEDFELHTLQALFPDLDELYVGKAGWRKFVNVWRSAWETIAVHVERMEDLGDDVLALITFEGVGRGSGAVASLTVAHWIAIREGRLADVRILMPEEALEAAGLSE